MRRFACLALAVALLAPLRARGEEGRYELGRRLRAFETALADEHSADALQRATPYLNEAVRDFFASRWAEAASALDLARLSLVSAEKPSAAVHWVAALSLRPHTFLLDAESDELGFVIEPFYKLSSKPPVVRIEVELRTHDRELAGEAKFGLGPLPHKDVVPIRSRHEQDYLLSADALVDNQRINIAQHKISLVADMRARLQRLRDGLRALPPVPRNTQRATLEDYAATLSALAHGGQMETNIPATRLLKEAEELLAAEQKGENYFGQRRAGNFWLTLAAPTGTVRVRLFAPDAVNGGEPLPLVIALHGVGGSEHMFFDAYGAGKIVDLCRQRDWLAVAPSATFFGLGLSAQKMVDAISQMYPVDKSRVMIVGHSMGAGHAVRIAELLTEPPRAIAALGAGGRVRQGDRLRNTAFFIAAGSEDFLLDQAKNLDQTLRQAGVTQVQFKEYPHVEHLAIVQLALDEAFRFFDKQIATPR